MVYSVRNRFILQNVWIIFQGNERTRAPIFLHAFDVFVRIQYTYYAMGFEMLNRRHFCNTTIQSTKSIWIISTDMENWITYTGFSLQHPSNNVLLLWFQEGFRWWWTTRSHQLSFQNIFKIKAENQEKCPWILNNWPRAKNLPKKNKQHCDAVAKNSGCANAAASADFVVVDVFFYLEYFSLRFLHFWIFTFVYTHIRPLVAPYM